MVGHMEAHFTDTAPVFAVVAVVNNAGICYYLEVVPNQARLFRHRDTYIIDVISSQCEQIGHILLHRFLAVYGIHKPHRRRYPKTAYRQPQTY